MGKVNIEGGYKFILTSLLFTSETSHFILSEFPPSNNVYFTIPWHSLKGCSPLESRLSREGEVYWTRV